MAKKMAGSGGCRPLLGLVFETFYFSVRNFTFVREKASLDITRMVILLNDILCLLNIEKLLNSDICCLFLFEVWSKYCLYWLWRISLLLEELPVTMLEY